MELGTEIRIEIAMWKRSILRRQQGLRRGMGTYRQAAQTAGVRRAAKRTKLLLPLCEEGPWEDRRSRDPQTSTEPRAVCHRRSEEVWWVATAPGSAGFTRLLLLRESRFSRAGLGNTSDTVPAWRAVSGEEDELEEVVSCSWNLAARKWMRRGDTLSGSKPPLLLGYGPLRRAYRLRLETLPRGTGVWKLHCGGESLGSVMGKRGRPSGHHVRISFQHFTDGASYGEFMQHMQAACKLYPSFPTSSSYLLKS